MYLILLVLPFISFITVILGSRWFGHRGAAVISLSIITFGLFTSFLIFYEVVILKNLAYLNLGTWIATGSLNISWSFIFDFLSVSMTLTVYLVSTTVHYYSCDYMWGDPHFPRFMAYLSFFTFFMILLSTSGNLPQLFIGWEGVGLCSYLLVSFWFTRTQANVSSLKAFIINRIGDSFFIAGLALVFISFHSLEFSDIALVSYHQGKSFEIYPTVFGSEHFFFKKIQAFGIIDFKWGELACFCFFIGVMSKSAQIFLHGWLPDAMEGPTPVSALIHAATMVVAGVYLLLRLSFIFQMFPKILLIVSLVGATTCFFSGTIAIFQNDLKKVIAYSTCSQLGYMIFIAGLSFYNVCFFHLCSHAFFKALLFLSAGSIIHSIGDFQDIRKIGGLISKLPITYSAFLVGSVSLSGLPFLSGFFSKDLILEVASQSDNYLAYFVKFLALFSAFLTSIYSFRLFYFAFLVKTKLSKSVFFSINESFTLITKSLVFLVFFSIFFGFFFKDLFASFSSSNAFAFSSNPQVLFQVFDAELVSYFYKINALLLSMAGIYVSFFFLNIRFSALANYTRFWVFFSKKWLFDSIYISLLAKPGLQFSYENLYKVLDKGHIERLGPHLLSSVLYFWSKFVKKSQIGGLYYYLYFFVIAILLITVFIALIFHFFRYPVFLNYIVLLFLYFVVLVNLSSKKNEL